MMTTRKRADDAPTYDPHVERAPWTELNTIAKQLTAIGAAFLLLLGVCGWILQKSSDHEAILALQVEVKAMRDEVKAVKSVACFLSKKSDQPITPPECNQVTP
jgi:hypothetical protein